MTSDLNKDIIRIDYNHLNLPILVLFNNEDRIQYTYDATGIKLEKKVTVDNVNSYTYYASNYIYEKDNNGESLQFFSHPEGYVEKDGSSFRYVYQYKDHLGNVRLSYQDINNDGSVNNSEIKEENNYYPFGLEHKGYNNVVNGTEHPYKYNGKEHNQELGLDSYDFGARNYDPALGRWMSVDPLADDPDQVDKSPYAFTWNNPINMVDPTGLKPEDIIFTNNDGNEIARILTNDETDTYVSVDTDVNLPTPVEIDARTDDVADAVGINFEWSITVGGGAHGGTGFVYFMNGEDEGSLFNYDYKGGNVGLGEGFGISAYASEFNSEGAPDSFNSVEGFGGRYNGYEASYGIGGVSYSWSNVNNTSDELYPGMRSTWTWKNRSLGGAIGLDKSSPKFQARFFGGETYDFSKINID